MSDVTTEGSWVFTCGCGNEIRVKNAGVVCSSDGCDHCRAVIRREIEQFDPLDGLVGQELDWCGCGNPEDVDRMMLAYLEARAVEGSPKPDPDGVSPDAALLLSYIADKLGWTEHGGAVGGAWLSDDGLEALGNLRLRGPSLRD